MTPDYRDRMREALGQPAAEGHPTADVLNAYAEQALTATEAQQVLQHLSVCAECREVVYLASAAQEEPAAASVAEVFKKKTRWWAWAVPVAATAVVASTILLLRSEREPRESTKYVAQNTKQEVPQSAAAPAPTSEDEKPAVPAKSDKTRQAPPVAALETAPPRRALEKDKTANAPAEAPPPSLDNLTRMEAKNAPTIPQPVPMQRRDAFAYNRTAAAPAPAPEAVGGVMSAEVSKEEERIEVPQTNSTEAAKVNSTVGVALPSSYSATSMRAKKALIATWRVTAAGTLEHFVSDKWKSLPTSPDAQILTVGSFGANVWAAAKDLQLYHSGDGGQHWERQRLPEEAQGEIVRLTFTSELDGALQTSTSGTWSTHDGGKTWARANRAPR